MNLFDPPQDGETADQVPVPSAGMDYYGQCRRSGELHSDFFDFVQREDGGLLFFIGDVAGYGHSSKMIASGIGNLLRSKPEGALKPLIEEINRAVCDLSPNGLYVTLFCAIADPVLRKVTYVNAGHEPVILLSRDSRRPRRLESTGTVLGLTTRSAYRQHSVALEAGDILAAFTDGITEAAGPHGEEFGEEGVVRVLRENRDAGAAELCEAVLTAVDQVSDNGNATDDQTVAVVRFKDRAVWEPVEREVKEEVRELVMAAA